MKTIIIKANKFRKALALLGGERARLNPSLKVITCERNSSNSSLSSKVQH